MVVPTNDEELKKHLGAATIHTMDAKDTFFFHRTEPCEEIHSKIAQKYGEETIVSHMDRNSVLKISIDIDSTVDEMVRNIRHILKHKGAVLIEIFTTKEISIVYNRDLPSFFKDCTVLRISPIKETDKLIYGYIYSGRFFNTRENDFELNFNKIQKINA